MTMYDRIRDLRISQDMSQDSLAKAMGYKNRSMIARIEAGDVDLSQSKIVAFARIFGVTTRYLMDGETDYNPDEARLIRAYRKAEPAIREAALVMLENSAKKDTQSERMA